MKKSILIAAVAGVMVLGSTFSSYANIFIDCSKGGRLREENNANNEEYQEYLANSKTKVVGDIHPYEGRIEGTWEQKEDGWYYRLPDGSYLKDNYVDGCYLSWTGRWVESMSKAFNKYVYNTLYAGHDSNYYDEFDLTKVVEIFGGAHGQVRSVLYDTSIMDDVGAGKSGREINPEFRWTDHLDLLAASNQWLNETATRHINEDEYTRAVSLLYELSNRVSYTRFDEAGASIVGSQYDTHNPYDTIYCGEGICQGIAEAYTLLCNKAGLESCIQAGDARGGGHAWCMVRANGKIYWVDPTFYDSTKSNEYVMSPTLFEGYIG